MFKYIFPCRPAKDEKNCPVAACTCSPRQCSDHCFFVAALDIAYGEKKLFVSLSEPTFSTFVRSELQHHGRTNLRVCQRKYFYLKPNPIPSGSATIALEGLKAFRVLELLLGDHIETLAQTLSYFPVETRLCEIREPETDKGKNLYERFYSSVYNAVKTWLEDCEKEKIELGSKIDTAVVDSAVPPAVKGYQTILLKYTMEILRSPLSDARESLKMEWPDDETTINAFFEDRNNDGKNLYQLIMKEWETQLDILLPMSARCLPLYSKSEQSRTTTDFSESGRLKPQHYVGFVDFRPRAGSSPIAMALLVPPAKLSNCTIIEDDYTTPFGVARDHYQQARLSPPSDSLNIETEEWKSSFYAMHDSAKEAGARCAHLCIIMACGLLSSKGSYPDEETARIPGPFEVSYFAAKIDNQNPKDQSEGYAPEGYTAWEFDPTEGLTPQRVVEVLQQKCGVSAFFYRRDNNAKSSVLILERLLKAYVSAGFPVIMFCNATGLHEPKSLPSSYTNHREAAHCVLVNGFAGPNDDAPTGKLTHLVIHDPGYAPFMNVPFDQCIESAAKYEEKNYLNFVAVTRKSIKTNAADCLDDFVYRAFDLNDLRSDKSYFKNLPETEDKRWSLFDVLPDGHEIEIALMDADTLNKKVFSENSQEKLAYNNSVNMEEAERQKVEFIEQVRGSLKEYVHSKIWVVRLLDPEGYTDLVYLRNAEHPWQDGEEKKEDPEKRKKREIFITKQIKKYALTAEQIKQQLESFEPSPEPKLKSGPTSSSVTQTEGFSFVPSVLTSSSAMQFPDLTQKLTEWAAKRTEESKKPTPPALDVSLLRTRDILDILQNATLRINPDTIPDIAWLLQNKIIPRKMDVRVDPATIIDSLKYDWQSEDAKKYLEWLLERGYVSAIDILAFEDESGNNTNLDAIQQWITENLNGLKISAFSTYFPQIASERSGIRANVVAALKNSMLLGMRLRDDGLLLSQDVIVEVVGGSFMDRVVQSGRDVVQVRHRKRICSLVAQSLVAAYQEAKKSETNPTDGKCTFAMELEPGDCYLVNNLTSVDTFIEAADEVCRLKGLGKKETPISLNLDLGHYISAEIVPSEIDKRGDKIWKRFSHSHISCLHQGRQHYRDLPVVSNRSGFKGFAPKDWQTVSAYIERYCGESGLSGRDYPTTNAISLELEGCPCFAWIDKSLDTLFKLT